MNVLILREFVMEKTEDYQIEVFDLMRTSFQKVVEKIPKY